MFNLPITLVVGVTGDLPRILSAGVDIDNIVKVEPISLDNGTQLDVESYDNCEHVPHTLIHLEDGRLLPVRERPDEINVYLDAYRSLEGFFTTTPLSERPPATAIRGGLRLLHGGKCDTSVASTPA
jgi:hypothetical protein